MAFTVAFGMFTGQLVEAADISHNADFRIIEVSEHQGQLLVEVEHFKEDGTFDYFENYLWQGREGRTFSMVVND